MSRHALIDHGRLLDVVQWEVDLLAEAATAARPDARVPSCPGLTVAETVRHVGSVCQCVTRWLREGSRPAQWQRDPGPGQSLPGFLTESRDDLLAELHARDPASVADTWWPPDRTAGFWGRRMAHETTVHRTDVQTAAGVDVTDIADDVAADGIDEVLNVWFGHWLTELGVAGTREAAVVFEAGERRWVARAGPDGVLAWRAQRRDTADARVSSSPMQLYLWLWGRVTRGAVHTDGDDDAVAQIWALLRLATR